MTLIPRGIRVTVPFLVNLERNEKLDNPSVIMACHRPLLPANKSAKRHWLRPIVVAALAVPNLAAAQAIDTNRPGFSASPNVVGPGQWQVETGIDYARPDSDSHTISLPAAEIRFGVADQVEVFATYLSWAKSSSGDNDTSGLIDMAIGTKIDISDTGAKTQMAFGFLLSVPTGSDSFTSDRWDPSAAFIWLHNSDLPVAGTVKISKYQSGYQLDNGVKLPFSLGETSSAFVEWEANLPEGGGSTHWLNGGYQRADRRSHAARLQCRIGIE